MDDFVASLSKDSEYQYLSETLKASVSKHLLDEHFTMVAANDRYYEMFGYTKAEYEAKFHNRPDLFFKDDPKEMQKINEQVVQAFQNGKDRYNCVTRMKHKNGQKLWINLNGIFIDEYIDGFQISYSIMTNITDLMQTKLENDVMQDNFPGLISKYRVRESRYELLEGNKNFLNAFHTELSFEVAAIGQRDGLQDLTLRYPSLRRGENNQFVISPLVNETDRMYYHVNAQCVDWIDKDPVFLLIYTDITELTLQKQQLEVYNEKLHILAYADELTGGYNRRRFEQEAGEKVRSAGPGTYQMLWLNLQKFKALNETGGVEAGDQVLIYIYRQILNHLEADEFVSRLYSDNFVILMKNRSAEDTTSRLNTITRDINSFNQHSDFKYYLTFLVGIYPITDTEVPLTYCEDRAHAALKGSRRQSTDLFTYSYYSEASNRQMLYDKELENRMQDALDNREFKVYLQPKYAIKKQRFTGAEALIRWQDKTRGLISPAEFIPLFESNGFIVQIDHFVFDEVCQLIRTWLDEGKEAVRISVNMSRMHFNNKNFMDHYIKTVERLRIPKEYLEIELTETMVFNNPESFKMVVREIHRAGFTCSLDDFGSGYSTLSTLKDLDVDAIKLDKSFFTSRHMNNEKENTVVESILELSKALHMETIAEGIETEGQKAFLYKTACDMIQGYVFSKPLPIPEFNKLVFKAV